MATIFVNILYNLSKNYDDFNIKSDGLRSKYGPDFTPILHTVLGLQSVISY